MHKNFDDVECRQNALTNNAMLLLLLKIELLEIPPNYVVLTLKIFS